MEQKDIKVLEEEKATLSHAIAEEIRKRDNFVAKQNIIIDDLYAQYEMADAKLNAALREQEQKERKANVPAFYRQEEIKAEAEELKKNKRPIDLNDKNIPAIYRQQAKKVAESEPAFVLMPDTMDSDYAKVQAEIALLKKGRFR